MPLSWRMFAVVTVLVLAVSTAAAAAVEDDASVLGALSDSPPSELLVGGNRVLLYEFARNELLRQTNRYRDVTYYYVVQPHLERTTDGKVLVESFEGVADPSKEEAQITLEPGNVTSDDVFKAMRAASVDAYAQPSHLLPLTVYGLDIKVADLPIVRIPQENASVLTNPVHVIWTLPQGGAARLSEAFAAGAAAQVGYRTLVKLSQVQSTQITWSDVKKTRAFRDYTGPSGPKLLTAAQVVDLATSVLAELKVFHWEELSASDGGASARDYGTQLQAIIDRVINRRERKEAALETWLDPTRFAVPVDKWQAMVDEIRSVAIDAKNLNQDEWCRKYRNELETLSKRKTSGDSNTSFGLDVVIPYIDTPLGLDYANGGSDETYAEDQYKSLASSEDCGKKIAEHNFKYDWDGVRYEPKSIYVYERLSTIGDISDNELFTNYVIRQRFGRNTWSIK